MEVLVAFTIFAVTFTAVLQILSTSTRNDDWSAWVLAVERVRSDDQLQIIATVIRLFFN